MAGKGGNVETGDRRDAADAIDDVSPRLLQRAADRRDDTHTRNDYATLAHALLRTDGNGGAVGAAADSPDQDLVRRSLM